jgi:uncharacterized protein (DUF433 family)
MNVIIRDDFPIIQQDSSGAWRVGETRVLVELVLQAYRRGETPAQIVESYDTLALADVHAVIAYCLRNPDVVERYLGERKEQSQAVREKIQARQQSRPGFLKELESRLAERSPDNASPVE